MYSTSSELSIYYWGTKMAIINGKKRYAPEAAPRLETETKRYESQAAEEPDTTTRRYQPTPELKVPVPIKRADISRTDATRQYLPAYEFDVKIDTVSISFNKITNIGNGIEYEALVEGGKNDYPLLRQKPKKQPETLVLEKGLSEGTGSAIFALLKQGVRITNILIFVKRNGKVQRAYAIEEALIISKKFSDLDASRSGVFVERLELAHTGLNEVSVP